MILPRWLSLAGLAAHTVVGGALTLLLHWGAEPWAIALTALAVGVAHEQAETDEQGRYFADFRVDQANGGGPLNGTLDVLAFMLVPLLWWVFR